MKELNAPLTLKDLDKLKGSIFIYPTDTIYGIGCDATKTSLVKKIREIKHRDDKPFSVIAPSINWIEEHCEVNKIAKEYLAKLPGPYTFILKLKDQAVSTEVTKETIGLRIPDHWFTELIQQLNIPIVTTSVNLTGQAPLMDPEDLDPKIAKQVDFFINEGPKKGTPSKVIDLTNEPKIVRG